MESAQTNQDNPNNDQVTFRAAQDCVELVDHMGNDRRIVNAARVSFGKMVNEQEPPTSRDWGLINYLAKHNHDTPFHHCMIHLRLKMPIFVAREWFRHQIGFARNEISRRYVVQPVDCFVPQQLRKKDDNVKQGSSDESVDAEQDVMDFMENSMARSISDYRSLLTLGVCPEQARMVLPQSMMTEFVETGSLTAYARLYKLRIAADAQVEIRAYAEAIGHVLCGLYPIAWEALSKQNE
ncbi:MAG: FAD-dependent thymidylate synthase [Gammaproteobacteria bacterium]|nr:FAD-dependent thymidylate synthase [Gammaproteobacteria bacterium]